MSDDKLINKIERIYPILGEGFTTQGKSDGYVYVNGRKELVRPKWINHYMAKDVHKKIEDIKRDIGLLDIENAQIVLDIIDSHTGELIEPNNNFDREGNLK